MVITFPKREVHGGTGKRQRENTKKNVLDFSASINPYPPSFEWHCDPAILAYYPDDRDTELKRQIASTFNRTEEEICVGNGSIELIRVFCSVALKGMNKTFFTESPTFGEYTLSARLAGARKAEKVSKPPAQRARGRRSPRTQQILVNQEIRKGGSYG